jgi:hypothetical protein
MATSTSKTKATSDSPKWWHTVQRKLKPAGHKLAHFTLYSSVPGVLFIGSFLIARYLPNSDFSLPSEIILPIALFGILVTGFFYLYRWTFRYVFPGRSYRTATLPAQIASFLLIYALYGFNYAFPSIQKVADAILPSSFTTGFSSAITRIFVMGLVFWVVAYAIAWVFHHVKTLRGLQPLKLLVFVVCFIFIWQGAKLGVRLWTVRHQLTYSYSAQLPEKPDVAAQALSDTGTQTTSNTAGTQLPAKPNVYYLLFDRYASSETLQNVYSYNNTAFLDYLNSEGFVNRQPAYANYPFTTQSVASTLSMSYLNDLESRFKNDAGSFQTNFPYRNIIDNPPVAQVFKQNDYSYNQISSWWDVTRAGIKADNEPAKSFRLRVLGLTFWLTDLQRDIVYRSAFQPLLEKGITIGNTALIKYDLSRNPTQNFNDELQAVKDIAKNSTAQKQSNFTFAHFLSPHDPYIFNEDGSPVTYNGDRTDQDIDEYQKYTNQLIYITTRIEELISYIRTNDPNAVILFQPDEGPYPKEFRGQLSAQHYFDPKDLPNDASLKQKLGITASYYMPGIDESVVSKEITGSVNAFPFVLNHYLGYNIPYLPECNYSAGNKYVLYDFSLLTGRLNGTTDPENCKQYN